MFKGLHRKSVPPWEKDLMDLNTLGAVWVKIVVKLRGQHIAYRDYTRAQTIKPATVITTFNPIYHNFMNFMKTIIEHMIMPSPFYQHYISTNNESAHLLVAPCLQCELRYYYHHVHSVSSYRGAEAVVNSWDSWGFGTRGNIFTGYVSLEMYRPDKDLKM